MPVLGIKRRDACAGILSAKGRLPPPATGAPKFTPPPRLQYHRQDFVSFVGQANIACVETPRGASSPPYHFLFDAHTAGGATVLIQVCAPDVGPLGGRVPCGADAWHR